MAGRDLLANRSPQFLQRVGSKKVIETPVDPYQQEELVPKENPLVGQIQGNLKALEAPERIPAGPVRFQNYIKETLGAPNELGLIKDMYAGSKALVNDATDYGAQAVNQLLNPQKEAVADDEDKLRQR